MQLPRAGVRKFTFPTLRIASGNLLFRYFSRIIVVGRDEQFSSSLAGIGNGWKVHCHLQPGLQ